MNSLLTTIFLPFKPILVATLCVLLSGCAQIPTAPKQNGLATKPDAYIEKLVRRLKFGDTNTLFEPSKAEAVIAMGLYGDPGVVPVLTEYYLNGTNDNLRFEIVKSLGRIKNRSAVPVLEVALKDKYVFARKAASWALKEITGVTYSYDTTGEPSLVVPAVPVKSAPGL